MPNEAATIDAGEGTPPAGDQKIDSVTAAALADAIVSQVWARLPDNSTPAQQTQRTEQVSEFQKKAQQLLSNEKIDKDVVGVMLELIEGVKADLNEEQKQQLYKQALAQQDQAVHQYIFGLINRYGKNDPYIQKARVTIANEIINKFNEDRVRAQKYVEGQVDYEYFDKISVPVINGWLREPASPGGPAVRNSAPTSAAKTEPGAPTSKEQLNDKQEEVYNSQVHFYRKNTNLSEEQIKEKALAAAGRYKGK